MGWEAGFALCLTGQVYVMITYFIVSSIKAGSCAYKGLMLNIVTILPFLLEVSCDNNTALSSIGRVDDSK